MDSKKYSKQSEAIGTGQVFIDSFTGLTFGIRHITYDKFASGSITVPNGSTAEITNASPGQKWSFIHNGKEFELILLELNYLYDSYRVQLTEK